MTSGHKICILGFAEMAEPLARPYTILTILAILTLLSFPAANT